MFMLRQFRLISVSAPTKFVPWSEYRHTTSPLRQTMLIRQVIKQGVSAFSDSSRCIPRVLKQVKIKANLFVQILRVSLVSKGPNMSTPQWEKGLILGINLSQGKGAICG